MYPLTHHGRDGRLVAATVNPVRAALVGLRVGGVEVVQPLADPADPPLWAGATLAPWPNRVRDGVWTLHGRALRLARNDPTRRNAVHGLLGSTRFTRQPWSTDAVLVLSTLIEACPGYPFRIALTVTYALRDGGLTVTYDARNTGTDPAPFAIGAHPYFVVGEHPTGELTLAIPAATVLVNDARHLPVGREPVAGDLDLRAGRPVSAVHSNLCYTDLAADDGEVVCTLTGPQAQVAVWGEPAFAYWQVFNPADFPGPSGPVRALAVEPMTAPPDALNSGEGLRWLAPGESWRCSWGVRVTPR